MKNTKFIATFVLASSAIFPSSSFAAVAISNGELEVRIRSDNGAIDRVSFGDTDWYNPGSPISDWGLQIAQDTNTFRLNTTTGALGISVSAVTPGTNIMSAEVDATYNVSGNTISVNRSYSILDGVNGLRVVTNLTNESSNSLTLRLFDTYDPDQGANLNGEFSTFMDVAEISTSQGDILLGQAWIDSPAALSVSMGSTDLRGTIASGGPFNIGSGNELNHFFATPFDADGDFIDSGTHLGFIFSLDPGESESLTFTQVYGDTPADNIVAFETALASSILGGTPTIVDDEGGTFIPLPAAFPLFGSALIPLVLFGRQRKKGIKATTYAY